MCESLTWRIPPFVLSHMKWEEGAAPQGNDCLPEQNRPLSVRRLSLLSTLIAGAGEAKVRSVSGFSPGPNRSQRRCPMRIIRDERRLSAPLRGGVYALGNFDGLHRGHQAVIAQAVAQAAARGAVSGMITFDPPPGDYFRPGDPPARLTGFRLKAQLLAGLGLDLLILLRFGPGLARMSAQAFAERILAGRIGAGGVVVGPNFRFGKDRGGDSRTLREMGARAGFAVQVAEQVGGAGAPVSSTRVRALLGAGRLAPAAELLGRWWGFSGRVRRGEGRGAQLGFATANLPAARRMPLAFGVYAARVWIGRGAHRGWHQAVLNLGARPTFGPAAPLMEVHLLDFSADLYGERLNVFPLFFLRAERRFSGPAALRAQIAEDIRAARRGLARAGRGSFAPFA